MEKIIGEEVFEKLQKNNENFEKYLNQNIYIKAEEKISHLKEYVTKYKGCKKRVSRDKIYFAEFYGVLLEYGKDRLKCTINQEDITEDFREEFESQLICYLQEICLRTLIVKVHQYEQLGQLKGENEKERYDYFCKKIIGRKEFLLNLLEEYPVLYRCVSETIEKTVNYYAEILQDFELEKKQIEDKFYNGKTIGKIQKIIGGHSDLHNNGKKVMRICFDNGCELLYKPRSMENEKIFAEILCWFEKETQITQYKYGILAYPDHSWCEIVSYGSSHSMEELKNYYTRLGVHLFLAYMLGTKDLHCENLIAVGEYPVLVDLETLTNIKYNQKRVTAKDEIYFQLSQSVLYSGILPFYSWNHSGGGTDSSAIRGKGGQIYPFRVPIVVDGETTKIHIAYKNPISKGKQNLATVEGEFWEPIVFKDELEKGFRSAYNAVLRKKEEALNLLNKLKSAKSRYLFADTQRYGMLLSSSFHPDLLTDGALREIFLYSMWKGRKANEKKIVENEVRELLNGDIPYFYFVMNSRDVTNIRGETEKDYFEEAPIEILMERLKDFNEADMEKQCVYMEWVLQTACNSERDYVNTVHESKKWSKVKTENDKWIKDTVNSLTNQIVKHAVWNKTRTEVSWYCFQFSAYGKQTWDTKAMNMYMYDGLAGMILVLHALKKVDERKVILELYHVVKSMLFRYTEEGNRNWTVVKNKFVGAYDGEASILYAYLIMYQLGEEECLAYAKKHAQIIERLIEYDKKYDLIAGNAGAAQVMILFYKLTLDKQYLHIAEKAVAYLEKSAKRQKIGIGWEVEKDISPMAGMAHGNSGILVPIMQLWELTGKEVYEKLAEEVWKYEDSLYDSESNNWKDMRAEGKYIDDIGAMAWCHGIPGILLSRLLCLEVTDNLKWRQRLEKDILKAYYKLDQFWKRDSYCICHGSFGNLWIRNRVKKFLGETEAKCSAYEGCNGIELLQQEKLNPGLFNGYGGILYYLLCEGDLSKILEF